MTNELESLDWHKGGGLLPAVVQCATTGRVLMLGYMNKESLDRTVESGLVTFFSRSRRRLWTKGETSGNVLRLATLGVDCDGDALLVRAHATGPTCHTGRESCFSESVAGEDAPLTFLTRLESIVDQRIATRTPGSYTAALAQEGVRRLAQKIGEEGVELALAAVVGDKDEVTDETADLLYHILVLLRMRSLRMSDVAARLEHRHIEATSRSDSVAV